MLGFRPGYGQVLDKIQPVLFQKFLTNVIPIVVWLNFLNFKPCYLYRIHAPKKFLDMTHQMIITEAMIHPYAMDLIKVQDLTHPLISVEPNLGMPSLCLMS